VIDHTMNVIEGSLVAVLLFVTGVAVGTGEFLTGGVALTMAAVVVSTLFYETEEQPVEPGSS